FLSIPRIVEELKLSRGVQDCITHVEHFPAQAAKFARFPEGLDPLVIEVFKKRGIEQLYAHQSDAVQKTLDGRNVVVVTPTASGKTLCYNIPVLTRVLTQPGARALYVFPTKALAQDQMEELYQLIQLTGRDLKTFTYDGDTPQDARRAIRAQGHVVVSNPDMLHAALLPHYTKWRELFETLCAVF